MSPTARMQGTVRHQDEMGWVLASYIVAAAILPFP